MNTLDYLIGLRPALPFSSEKPCTPVSNSELKRWIANGTILINTERVVAEEIIDYPVFSLVFFPKSEKRRTTIV